MYIKNKVRWSLGVTMITLALLNAPLASAQTAGGEKEEEVMVLSPFTVEAGEGGGYQANASFSTSRAAVSFMDMPLSVQVVTRELIEDTGVFTMADAIKFVSGTSEGRLPQGGGISFALRGFSFVTVSVDGFSQAFSEGRNNLANLERIEVLKGPSAILFTQGGNPGGTVNMITKRPTQRKATSISATVGAFNGNLIELDSGGRIGKSPLLYRFVGTYQDGDDFWDHYPTKTTFLAPSLAWELSDTAKLTLKYEHNDREEGIINGQPLDESDLANPKTFVGLRQEWQTNDAGDRTISKDEFWSADLEFKVSDVTSGFMGIQYGTSSPQRIASRPIGNPTVRSDGSIPRKAFHILWEAESMRSFVDFASRFKAFGTSHNLVTGAEFTFVRTASSGDVNEPAAVVPDGQLNVTTGPFARTVRVEDIVLGAASQTKTAKAFVMDSVSFWKDRVAVMGGVTWNWVENPQSKEVTNSVAQYGVMFRPAKQVMIYGSKTENFNPNFANLGVRDANDEAVRDQNGNPVNLGPAPAQTNESEEIGVKAVLFDDKFSITAAHFDTAITNRTQLILGTSLYTLVGGGKSSGYELDVAGQLTDRFNMILAYSKIKAVDDNGVLIENAPEDIFSVWGRYDFPMQEGRKLSVGGGIDYVGDRQGVGRGGIRFNVPGRTLLNLAVIYRHSKNLSLQVNVQNLADEYYYTSGFQPARIATGRGRNITLKTTYAF